MRLRNRLTVTILFALGGILAAGNVWFAAARSTIPLSLNGEIRTKERRPEKHLGVDDVYLLHLESAGLVQVDRHVFDHVREGEAIHKARWSNQLGHGGDVLTLKWSDDVCGLLITMSVALVLLAAMLAGAAMVQCNDLRLKRKTPH